MHNISKLVVLLIVFFQLNIANTQNLVSNGGFESPSTGSEPSWLNDIDDCSDWEDANTGIPQGAHSPEWLSSCSGHMAVEEFDNATSTWNIVGGSGSGCGYAGLGPAELIMQDVGTLGASQRYQFSLDLRLVDALWRWTLEPVSLAPTYPPSSKLSIMIAPQKLEYEFEEALCAADKKDSEDQNIVTVATIPLSPGAYPPGTWNNIPIEFTVPSDGFDYKWLAIEITHDEFNSCFRKIYGMIDNVDLQEVPCEECDLCSPTDGCINLVLANNPSGPNNPFKILGLDNVSHLKFEIYGTAGYSYPLWDVSIDDPNPVVAWNGKTNTGNEVPAASYPYKIIAENDCERVELTGNVQKMFTETTIYECGEMDYISVPKHDLSDACCNPCFVLNGESLDDNLACTIAQGNEPSFAFQAGQSYSFEAIGKIEFGPNVFVQPFSNLTLNAGVEIVVESSQIASSTITSNEVVVLQGAEVTFIIDPMNGCFDGFAGEVPDRADRGSEKNPVVEAYEPTIKITPNPNKGQFEISTDLFDHSNEQLQYQIFDSSGKMIVQNRLDSNTARIDISGQGRGLYFIMITNATGTLRYTDKILVQ